MTDIQAETLDLEAVLTAHIENEYNKVWAFDAVGVPAASVLAGDAIRIVREHDRPELERLRAKVEAVKALHTPRWTVGDKTYTHRVTVNAEDMTPAIRLTHVCVTGDTTDSFEEPCSDDEHQVEACSECRTSTPDYETASFFFPCPTVRALASHDGKESNE